MPVGITPTVQGEWVIDSTLPHHWAILNTRTGRRKIIGPVHRPRSQSKVNYFARADEIASERNANQKRKS